MSAANSCAVMRGDGLGHSPIMRGDGLGERAGLGKAGLWRLGWTMEAGLEKTAKPFVSTIHERGSDGSCGHALPQVKYLALFHFPTFPVPHQYIDPVLPTSVP